MDKKYSLHKIWFFYTDEWYVENGLGRSVGFFSTLEEAQKEKKKLDRVALKRMGSFDYLRDLMSFYEKSFEKTSEKVVAYALSQGWADSLTKREYSDGSGHYYEFALPATASDKQIDSILEITGAGFHRIIELNNVKDFAYVKMNYDFWGKKVFDKLKSEGTLETRTPYIDGWSNKGHYLIQKPLKGRKSAKFSSEDSARDALVKTFLECISAFPDNNFMGKTYVEDWSDEPALLIAYLSTCETIKLTETELTKENFKAISAKLKKQKATKTITLGMKYFEVNFNDLENTIAEEVNGLIGLLKIQPAAIFTGISEINGLTVKDYTMDSNTF